FLVVWHDYSGGDPANDGSVYGTRVSQTGQILDGTPIKIASYNRSQVAPRVVFDGTNYLVVWQTDAVGFKARLTDDYAVRVSPAGVVLDKRPITLAAATGNQFDPVVAYGGGKLLVAWAQGNTTRCPNGCVWAQLVAD